MTRKSTALIVAIALLAPVAAAQAQNKDRVRGEVLVVLAKEEKGSIDPALKDEKALQRPPFNAFQSMKVLDRPKLALAVGRSEEVELPNERRVKVELQQRLPNGRFRVRVSINRPNKSDYLPLLTVVASPGDPFFVAGQSYKGGTLVIGVRIGEKGDSGE